MAFPMIPLATSAQGGGQGGNPQMREAARLHVEGQHAEAQQIYRDLIAAASTPQERAAPQRAMARSAGFTGDCALAIEYEEMVIAYHQTREASDPQDAFYQQGEMANEAARICADAGALDEAERMYRRGSALGNREPAPRTHPRELWDFRLAHALTRIAAHRGQPAEAARHLVEARRALDAIAVVDSTLGRQQERFYQYLPGYVALFTNDIATAVSEFERSTAIPGNNRDPQLRFLLGLAYERAGRSEEAMAQYRRSYETASGNNPPNSFARREAGRKLEGQTGG
jgi:tetratricopeptide (TPR) repeat protein